MSQTASVADLPIRGNFIRGETSETIRDVQSILKKLGLYQGPVNGTFGNQTEKSVRAFSDIRNISEHDWAVEAPVHEIVKSEEPTDSIDFSIELSLIETLNRDIIS
jgi:peptidoglycan hydrolase-like protein with peptidoglycan-binding domain